MDTPVFAQKDNFCLKMPKCAPGIGSVISSLSSPHLIAGVQLRAFDLWPDDRGYFLEVQRLGLNLARTFDPATTQVSAALSHPGIIKAFHYHLEQTDCWTPVAGMFQVVLVDFRDGSETFGRKNTLYVGDLRPWQILIPPGVGHGYKVIGQKPAVLVYMTDRFYNPADEGRVSHNQTEVNYDWELQHK